MEEHSKIVSLSLGSNLGNKINNLEMAIHKLELYIGRVLKVSDFFHSKPVGFSSQNEFVNCCCLVKTSLSVNEFLEITQKIECELGRQKKYIDRYEDRIIDIDIVLFDNLVIREQRIRIPHQNFRKRDFVLLPLNQLSNQIDPETFIAMSQFTK